MSWRLDYAAGIVSLAPRDALTSAPGTLNLTSVGTYRRLRPLPRPQNRKGQRQGAGEIRLIGGRWRSRRISVPDRPDLRPTPDRLRETLFNWIGHDLRDSHCLDLFAGSGALGLEALSRGAQSATFVDSDGGAIESLARAVDQLECHSLANLINDDALRFIETTGQRFDIVFADPPFQGELLGPLIKSLADGQRLKPDALVFLEYHRDTTLPTMPENWQLHRSSTVGVSTGSLARVESVA